MTSRFFSIAVRSAIARTARFYPLCILTALVATVGLLSPDAQTKWLGYPTFALLTATALPSAFGALAGALAFQDASPGKRLLAHGIGFGLGLVGGLWSRLGLWSLPGEEEATALSLGFLAYLAVALSGTPMSLVSPASSSSPSVLSAWCSFTWSSRSSSVFAQCRSPESSMPSAWVSFVQSTRKLVCCRPGRPTKIRRAPAASQSWPRSWMSCSSPC